MRIQLKLLGGYLGISLIFIILGSFLVVNVNSINPIVSELDKEVDALSKSILLADIVSEIKALRAELMQATTNFALTQDESMQQQYILAEESMQKAINNAIEKSDNKIDKKIFEDLNEANEELKDIEKEVFTLAKENKEEAEALLTQEEYTNLNSDFPDFIKRYANKRRTESEDVFSKLVQISVSTQRNRQELNIVVRLVVLSLIVMVILSILLGGFIAHSISKPIQELTKASEQMKKGNLKYKIKFTSKDEIGELAETFNEMRLGLKDRNELLNTILTAFKGKLGGIASILLRKNIKELSDKNPRVLKIIPKSLAQSLKKQKKIEETLRKK